MPQVDVAHLLLGGFFCAEDFDLPAFFILQEWSKEFEAKKAELLKKLT